jgi:hypothetical protein
VATVDLARQAPSAIVFRNTLLGAAISLIVLTVILTWPQALHLASAVPDHDDPFLSMWRLNWIAHALLREPGRLFDGNIFYPHVRTLAYSDATLLEGLIATPWLWARVNPVLVYNLLLLTGIVSSGLGMFVLVRHLTDDPDAALVSAAIFTLAPYRIEHFMHLELQWTAWMPLTFWAIHRVFEKPSVRRGVAVGLLISLQLLCCIYYGVFLSFIVAVLVVLLAASRRDEARATVVPLCAGALVAAVVAALYSLPYIESAQVVGTRAEAETALFSAQMASYVAAPRQNWLWGWTSFPFEGDELHLFPGIVAVILASIGVAGNRRERLAWIYLAVAVLAIELSLGMNGTIYRWLYAHTTALRGFRAPARFAILAVCGLAVLAGFGFAYLKRRITASSTLFIAVLVAIGVECGSAPLRLMEVPRSTPDVYTFLRKLRDRQDGSAIIELPIASGLNVFYMFWSTQHWRSLVNGYSGYTPRGYNYTVKLMDTFPDEASIARLRALNVGHILVHEYYYAPRERTALMLAMMRRHELIPVGGYRDWIGTTRVFELRPAHPQPSVASPSPNGLTPAALP